MYKKTQKSKKRNDPKIKTESGKRLYQLMLADKSKAEKIRETQMKVIVSFAVIIIIIYLINHFFLRL
ncbi:MAG: hypothetical protein KAI18_04795 [Candidatus Aenigmarchaeota archaeon]|nr:hypothetical protein [Candidatus Aenigmarchaeota archaeon]